MADHAIEVGNDQMHGEKLKVALLCFFPDWGHILPLLKIGRALKESGHSVRCYIPSNAVDFADRADLEVFPIEVASGRERHALSKLASKSLFFLNYSGYSHTNLFVNPGIIENALNNIEIIERDMLGYGPDVVISDYHVVSPLYEMLSALCGANYVSHNPSGTLASEYRPIFRVYGETSVGPLVMSLIEIAGSAFEFSFRRVFYIFHMRHWLEARRVKRRMNQVAERAAILHEKWQLTTGLTWLERKFFGFKGLERGDPFKVDLPPIESIPDEIPDRIREWLNSSSEAVVYISFGSILRLSEDSYAQIIKSLERLHCRVIWSMPVSESRVVKELSNNDRFYVTRYVPQAELLKLDEIKCFVTHAGASSIQEALISGTPLVCVPLHADNGFISWLVERLGVGRRVWKSQLGGRAFSDAIEEIIRNPAFSERAKEVAENLRNAKSKDEIVAFVERIGSES